MTEILVQALKEDFAKALGEVRARKPGVHYSLAITSAWSRACSQGERKSQNMFKVLQAEGYR